MITSGTESCLFVGEVKPETEYRDSTDAVIKPEEKTKAYKYV